MHVTTPHRVTVALALVLAVAVCGHRDDYDDGLPPWRNWTLPVQQRVANLLSLLTTEEKLSLLYATSAAVPRIGLPSYNVSSC